MSLSATNPLNAALRPDLDQPQHDVGPPLSVALESPQSATSRREMSCIDGFQPIFLTNQRLRTKMEHATACPPDLLLSRPLHRNAFVRARHLQKTRSAF
jgi:hypothetical protein